MAAQQWTKLEQASIPEFTIANITNYFISRVASDGKHANDFKNLNSRAFPLFKAGHIQSIQVSTVNNIHHITCSCLPEMKKDILYKIHLQLDSNGDIIKTMCVCPAGVGPHGSCKHISALCYALEEFCRVKKIRSPKSCTSQLQEWNRPRKRKLDPCCSEAISFVKHEYGKRKRPTTSMAYDPRPDHLKVTSDDEISTLKDQLAATGENVVLLHLLPSNVPPPEILPWLATTLPSSPVVMQTTITSALASQPQPVSLDCIGTFALKFLSSLKYSTVQIEHVEQATRSQRLCERWHDERKFRLTASRFGTVVKRERNHSSLAKQMLYSEVRHGAVSALLWGQQHESDALDSYQETLSDSELVVEKTGIYVSECGFLGASPDGIVRDKSTDQTVRLVEVKCPYNARSKDIKEMYDDKGFCCSLFNGKPVLKKSHNYFFQVQGQMAVSGVHTCDFVVWSPISFVVITVPFDIAFWNVVCYPALKNFYFDFMLPEIVYPKYPELPLDYSHLSLY